MSAVPGLMRSNLAFLGGVLLALAIFLPLLKWLYLLLPALQRWTDVAAAQRTLAWLLRWWPQDVVAIAAAAALIASRETLVQRTAGGAYCFAGAVLVMALASTWLRPGAPPGPQARPQAVHDTPRGLAFAALVLLAIVAFALGVTLPGRPACRHRHRKCRPVHRRPRPGAAARGETALWVPIAILALLLPGLRLLYLLTVAAARALPKAIRSGAIRAAEILGRYATADTIALSLMLFYLMETRRGRPRRCCRPSTASPPRPSSPLPPTRGSTGPRVPRRNRSHRASRQGSRPSRRAGGPERRARGDGAGAQQSFFTTPTDGPIAPGSGMGAAGPRTYWKQAPTGFPSPLWGTPDLRGSAIPHPVPPPQRGYGIHTSDPYSLSAACNGDGGQTSKAGSLPLDGEGTGVG